MKYLSLSILLLVVGCLNDPTPTPAPVATKWIDVVTHRDTIVTNATGNPYILYYAVKNWQSFSDSSFTNGFRQIVGVKEDSIVVKLLNSTTTKVYGPFKASINLTKDTLKAQNFLDTANKIPARAFILLPQ